MGVWNRPVAQIPAAIKKGAGRPFLATRIVAWGSPPRLSRLSAANRRALVAEELARIHRHAALPDLEVHVRAGGTAGGTGLRDLATGANQVANAAQQARVVGVTGDVAVAVVDFDGVAVARTRAGKADHAVGDGQHRITDVGFEIDALVELVATADRVGTAAEAGG